MNVVVMKGFLKKPTRALAIRARTFERWVERARPGARIEYHCGHLAVDRMSSFPESARRELNRIADRAFALAAEGRLLLVQRRIGSAGFSYVAIKAKSPKQKPAPARSCAVDRGASHPMKEAA